MFRNSIYTLIWTASLAAMLSGCGVLIGSVKPIDNKAENYEYLDLSDRDSKWEKVDLVESKEDEETATQVSDISYQHKSTHSSITVNSSCATGKTYADADLKKYSNLLFLGIDETEKRNEKFTQITASNKALESTLTGKMNSEDVKMRTVVFSRGDCLYDLIYVARPNHFTKHEALFSEFVHSFKIK